MRSEKLPFVSVIIVNYNGAHFLPTCLDALRDSTYSADCFQVIVSDNGSTDGSLELLETRYPWVQVLKNGENLGFASGNNRAIEIARGEYVVLLNNDTMPSSGWLENLVRVAENDPRAGLVTGRLQLFYDQLIVQIDSETIQPANDGRVLGVQVFGVESGTPNGIVQYVDGFYGWEKNPSSDAFRWTRDRAVIGVPVHHRPGDADLILRLAASRYDAAPVKVRISLDGTVSADWIVSGAAPRDYRLPLPASLRCLAHPLVQNTGSLAFRNGLGRDRGTFVKQNEVFYEVDEGQYDRVEEVFAGCGASLLIRKSLIDEIGAFDDDFFMYYEDTDLAWRARLRGWKVLYAPQAIVRHVHCGTSVEWSSLFLYLTARNRLAMVFKNGTRSQVLATWGKFSAGIARNILLLARCVLLRQPIPAHLKSLVGSQSRALGKLLFSLPKLWNKRRAIQGERVAPFSEINKWFVD